MRSTIFALLAISAATVFACGGSQPAANPPPTGEPTTADAAPAPASTADAGATAAPAPKAAEAAPNETPSWNSLPKDKKVEVMMAKVVPNVGKVFKEHDGKKFEKFNCATCHGAKKEDPHKALPKLTLSNGGFEKLSKAKPEMMKFMGEKVVPEMAAALGQKPYDPATKQGFGCAGCHTVE